MLTVNLKTDQKKTPNKQTSSDLIGRWHVQLWKLFKVYILTWKLRFVLWSHFKLIMNITYVKKP